MTALAAIRKTFGFGYGCVAHRLATVMEKSEELYKASQKSYKKGFTKQFELLQTAIAKLAFSLIKIPSFSVTRRWRGLYQLVKKFIEKYYEIQKEAASRPEKDRYELPNLLFLEDL